MAERSFGPVVLAGLGAGVLAAFGGNQAFAVIGADPDGAASDVAGVAVAATEASAPLVTAVALVVLASWGVVLVTRGRFRRLVAWLGLVSAVGLVASAVAAWSQAPREVSDAFSTYGVGSAEVDRTVWSWVTLAASVVALAAAAVAVRRVGTWPEMGRRYDAPATRPERVVSTGEPGDAEGQPSSLDLWKAIDEGDDPTTGSRQ